jgi:hypothetical protein
MLGMVGLKIKASSIEKVQGRYGFPNAQDRKLIHGFGSL